MFASQNCILTDTLCHTFHYQHNAFITVFCDGFVFAGQNCELINSLCYSSPCQHNGTCSGTTTSYTCSCPFEWKGTDCETQVCVKFKQKKGNCCDEYMVGVQVHMREFRHQICQQAVGWNVCIMCVCVMCECVHKCECGGFFCACVCMSMVCVCVCVMYMRR